MNKVQKLVLAGGGILLFLNFLFPYTQYPVKVSSQNGPLIKAGVTVHHGFMPVWAALAQHEQATLKGNPFNDTIIQWCQVFASAVAIVVLCGCGCYGLRRKQEKPTGAAKASGVDSV